MARRKYIDISPTADAFIYGALALLLLPLKWILAAAVAAIFHECCHYLALRLCGVRVYGISVASRGAVMETEVVSDGQELVCALAGPAGSLLLVLLIRYLPELAICAGIQGLYNLLPIYPLDGGRAVRSILGILCPRHRDALVTGIQYGTTICVFITGLIFSFCFRLGFGVLITTFLLICKGLPRKIPCKEAHKRVQ